MRYAFISDLHATIEALAPVLDAIDALGVDEIFCLGDIVGRNASPNEVIDALRSRKIRSVAGNHDRAVLGTKEMAHFNQRARSAVHFARDHLTPENRRYLEKLPLSRTIDDHFVLVHAALHPEPNDDIYLNSPERLGESLHVLRSREGGPKIAFFGHTHRPGVHRLRLRDAQPDQVESSTLSKQKLEPDFVYLINPGSVGQSRDGDARASFLIYDRARARIEIHRVPFDHLAVMASSSVAGRYEAKAPEETPLARASARSSAPSPRPPPRPAPGASALSSQPPRAPPRAQSQQPGSHSVRFDPPDVVFVTYEGNASVEDMGEVSEAIRQIAHGKSGVLLVSDLRALGATSVEARSALARTALLSRGAAFYGASTKPQVLHALLAAALSPAYREADIPLLFFDTEAEARGWVLERRRALGAPRRLSRVCKRHSSPARHATPGSAGRLAPNEAGERCYRRSPAWGQLALGDEQRGPLSSAELLAVTRPL